MQCTLVSGPDSHLHWVPTGNSAWYGLAQSCVANEGGLMSEPAPIQPGSNNCHHVLPVVRLEEKFANVHRFFF